MSGVVLAFDLWGGEITDILSDSQGEVQRRGSTLIKINEQKYSVVF